MSVVIKAVQLEGFNVLPSPSERIAGQWLEAFDVDAFDGWGDALFTADINRAMRFADLGAAFTAWKTQSTVRPLRADGEPNRPLTAFSITFEEAPP
jgi:hypothetical protein